MQMRHFFVRALAVLAIAVLPIMASAQLAPVSEDTFDDGVTTTNTTGLGNTTWVDSTGLFGGGTDSITEAGGASVHVAGADNWGRVEMHDNQEFVAPHQSGGTINQVQYNWTVGSVNVTNDQTGATANDNRDYRVQLNVHDADQAQGTGSERWLNTAAGAISLDLFFDASAGGAGVAGYEAQAFEKDFTQLSATDGTGVNTPAAAGTTSWDGAAEQTFTLTMDTTGYTWSSTEASFVPFTQTWAGSNFVSNEFDNGIWGATSVQNNNAGRGDAAITAYSVLVDPVATVPEPGSALLLCGSLGLFVMRRRRS